MGLDKGDAGTSETNGDGGEAALAALPASQVKVLIERYLEREGMTQTKFLAKSGLKLEELRVALGNRDRKPNNELLKKLTKILTELDALQESSTAFIQERSLFGFKMVEKYFFEEDMPKYEGRWIGVGGSTFTPGSLFLFTMEVSKTIPSFQVEYKQKKQHSSLMTSYHGRMYFILNQLWMFIEEVEGMEFTCMALARSPSSILSPPKSLMGVFMGRGGEFQAAYPAAAKVGLIRREVVGEDMLTLVESGWMGVEKLRNTANKQQDSSNKNIVNDVIEYVSKGLSIGPG